MQYAIEILNREAELLKKCLSKWDVKEYPEAKKEREKRLKEISNAIKAIAAQSC